MDLRFMQYFSESKNLSQETPRKDSFDVFDTKVICMQSEANQPITGPIN